MATRKTCSKCANFTATAPHYMPNHGECKLMGDVNDIYGQGAEARSDKCYGWDGESYCAGVYVGKDFGCIHWMKA
jgi:hypothetical protein